MSLSRKEVGKKGEETAASFLEKKGFAFIERNWKAEGFGEIDLVCLYNNKIVFVEVKSQVEDKFKEPEEAVDERKIRALARTAFLYKEAHPKLPEGLRIDVVGIIFDSTLNVKEIRHFENVYEEQG